MLTATNGPVKSYTILTSVKALAFLMEKVASIYGVHSNTSYCSATHFWGEFSLVQEWFHMGYSHSSYYNCHGCTVDSPLTTIYIFPTY
jgi:hypothetical protein